ncbi:translocon-associated protein subunit beta isoform X2 [Octopus sinensis]|uniref:Translocon-associated protein subunit beta n=1 Tax=Octopus sinensis TaxID=2607531 RepID=A0A7E6EYQ9_9MOLL|nr:translocon-associated protein subunit beta isoform X2 [Octopus sinensis]
MLTWHLTQMMNSLSLLSVSLSFLCLFALTLGAEDEKIARLLASKNVMNQYLVEGKDVTVEYRIFNVGEATATDVKLKEEGFPASDFSLVQGFLEVQWDRIAPKSNVTHAVVMKPLKFGFFNFTAAQLTYLPKDDAEERMIGYTSAPGEGGIINQKEFERRFSPHVLDWLIFAIMTLPSLGIPYMLWYRSKRKYDNVRSKRN